MPALFDPAYIGGRSAVEHRDLTEQIFRDIVVLTGQPVREKVQQRHNVLFSLKHIGEGKTSALKPFGAARAKSLSPIFTARLSMYWMARP